ncbi:restriction endonuclease [Micromonospora cathayae]|uniref:Restriction endonuclease n=1 Tax=Micromonospora cathayae TaxID=3028804 RepID=A0ABY7ZJY7_9ACTN|nr:restriction endonuclease [Micromonospora sp. HUAS 3]WDZ82766.1 restriction endonuclease [Micromonospora sp. HUAS 3]
MPRVRSYTRRDGVRVRAHQRRARGRSTRRRSAGGGQTGPVLAGLGGLVALVIVVDLVRRHPYRAAAVAALLVAGAVAVAVALSRRQARRRAEQAERDRLVAVTDPMTGAEFERWFARLLAGSGFTDVRVCGGAGDRGADVLATAPDGRRVVVQCKRRHPGNRVDSAAIQRFAGTCRTVHRGELCLIVTNGFFTNGDGRRFARQVGIVLVDRDALETWAYTAVPPADLLRP